ncbi:hypothetical protein CVT25_011754 [Psilocybe cyanescens]|uniref:Uncharacterized protein n=1 Tax=Psilocybe cyanescens TaxID=93625 RepID=A0A409WIH9_PSICY|nr:hypothetical protein CVT25_011754 [Psilocybe cyanescens]
MAIFDRSAFIRWQGWSVVIATVLVQGIVIIENFAYGFNQLQGEYLAILQVRIYALYLGSKIILTVTLIGFLTTTTLSSWIMGRAISSSSGERSKNQIVIYVFDQEHSLVTLIPLEHADIFCVPFELHVKVYFFWVPVIIYEILLLVLALVRGLRMVNVRSLCHRTSFVKNGQQLVSILLRDSLLYFFLYVL